MSEVSILELELHKEQQTKSNPLEHFVSCGFNKEKALDEFRAWLNDSGVSFKHTSKFNTKCPELAKLLDL